MSVRQTDGGSFEEPEHEESLCASRICDLWLTTSAFRTTQGLQNQGFAMGRPRAKPRRWNFPSTCWITVVLCSTISPFPHTSFGLTADVDYLRRRTLLHGINSKRRKWENWPDQIRAKRILDFPMAFLSLSGLSVHAAFSGTLKFAGTNLGGSRPPYRTKPRKRKRKSEKFCT